MDNQMQGLGKLKGIAIAEIILGILSFLGLIQQRGAYSTTSALINGALLLAAGVLGVITVSNSRKMVYNVRHFRILAILNIVLGVLSILGVITSIVFIGIVASDLCDVDCASALGVHVDFVDWVTVKWTLLAIFIVFAVASVLFAMLAFTAASIARKNARILMTAPTMIQPGQGFNSMPTQSGIPITFVKA